MEQKRGTPPPAKDDRGDRLKSALKSNLAKRKAQAKARSGDGDEQDRDS
ncbi:hypothetical protein LVO79_02995 [Roseivivax marinus]|jgi:hypothetical protein|nr:hypothetical protein [Roseivivax marinus]UMA65444.1 hypothetical protein LVO79_02995 [Roseivivax marinus]SEL78799.1 hypothetical protein SAMN05444413_11658 [Roseivivax marinus]